MEKLFEYDAWNRLIGVREKTSNQEIATYTYDAHNRRVRKTLPSKTTDYVYSNWSLVEEYTNKQLSKTYIHGKTMDEPLALKTDGQEYFYHCDRMGSITGLSDSKGGMAAEYPRRPPKIPQLFVCGARRGFKIKGVGFNDPT